MVDILNNTKVMSTRSSYIKAMKKKRAEEAVRAKSAPVLPAPLGKNSNNPIIKEAYMKGLSKPKTEKVVPRLTNPLPVKPKRNLTRRVSRIRR